MKYLLPFFLVFALIAGCGGSDDSDTPPDNSEPIVKDFFVWDLSIMPPVVKIVTATLRSEGSNSYIYVDNDEWNVSVTQDQADELLTWFENRTPEGSMNMSQGIFDNDVQLFGEPPDKFDNDPKIYILLTELSSYGGYEFDGYFNSFDQMSDAEAQTYGERSNEKEILYINPVIRPVDAAGTLSVIAHEFVHMIQSNYDDDEMWIQESLAELGMLINGYYTDGAWVNNFLNHPNYSLPGESANSVNYGACLLWGLYLHEQINDPLFFQRVMRENEDGIAGLDAVLSEMNEQSFAYHYLNWLMANYLDDTTIGQGEFGYSMIDINSPSTTDVATYPTTASKSIHRYGAAYYLAQGFDQESLRITIQTNNPEDIYVGFLEMDATGPNFGFYPVFTEDYTFTFENPAFSELPVIVTSVSDQQELDVTITFDQGN